MNNQVQVLLQIENNSSDKAIQTNQAVNKITSYLLLAPGHRALQLAMYGGEMDHPK